MTGQLPTNWRNGKRTDFLFLSSDSMTNDHPTRRIAIFGSTGSIGTQALEVIAANPSVFSAEVLTAYNNEELLIEQARRFNPNIS